MAVNTLAALVVAVFLLFFVFCLLFVTAFLCIGSRSLLRWLWTRRP